MVYAEMDSSLKQEIDFYLTDFNGYAFNNWEEFFEQEKTCYTRWSSLLKTASKDLMREENGVLKFHARGETARAAINSMYKNPPNEVYSKIYCDILLLLSTLPENWFSIRKKMSKILQEETGAIVKVVPESTHLLHWDYPEVVVVEVRLSFA